MSDTSVQLVVFDIGGVMVRICRSWHDAFDRAGIAADHGLLENAEWIGRANIDFECGRITHDELITRATDVAANCTRDEVTALVDAWLIEPYAGVAAMIDRIKSAGLRTACLSNTNARHWQIMTESDPRFAHIPALDTRIASHLVGVMKPDAGIYEALERATHLTGKQIVFFDDLDANIAAAAARGWHACEIDHAGDPAAQMTDHLRELGAL